MNKISAFAPASIANLNAGFDILGLALNTLGDTVELTFNNTTENVINEIVNGDNLPKEVQKNSCSVVIRKMQEQLNDFQGVDIKIIKGFESGSGLGSSSASCAAAAIAYNEILGNPFSKRELVYFAGEGESVASGTIHYDNVAPAIFRGLTLVKDAETILNLPIPENLYMVVLFQKIEIKTSDARNILPNEISRQTSVKQSAHLASFIVALYENDLDLMRKSMKDFIAEPHRSKLIPNFMELKEIAEKNNCISFGISGSGPTVFTLVEGQETAQNIENQFNEYLKNTLIPYHLFVDKIS